MKRFYINVINEKIKLAATDAEKLLEAESEMMKDLLFKNDFKFNSGTGYQVCEKLQLFNKSVPVFTYKPFNPFTKSMGYSDGKAIFINIRKLDSFSHQDLVGLLLHEYCHMVGFSHGNNYKTADKVKYSVPYFVSENVGEWL